MFVVAHGHLAVAKYLASKRGNVSYVTQGKWRPLHFAAMTNNAEMVAWLLQVRCSRAGEGRSRGAGSVQLDCAAACTARGCAPTEGGPPTYARFCARYYARLLLTDDLLVICTCSLLLADRRQGRHDGREQNWECAPLGVHRQPCRAEAVAKDTRLGSQGNCFTANARTV